MDEAELAALIEESLKSMGWGADEIESKTVVPVISYLQNLNLPLLRQLAMDLLSAVEGAMSPMGDKKKYKEVKKAFDDTKKVFSNSMYLDAMYPVFKNTDDRVIFRLANLAAASANLMELDDGGLPELSRNFHGIMTRESVAVMPEKAREVFLALQTQEFIRLFVEAAPRPDRRNATAKKSLATAFANSTEKELLNYSGWGLTDGQTKLVKSVKDSRLLLQLEAQREGGIESIQARFPIGNVKVLVRSYITHLHEVVRGIAEDEGPAPPPPWKVAEVRGLLQDVVDEIDAEEVAEIMAEILAGQEVDVASPVASSSSQNVAPVGAQQVAPQPQPSLAPTPSADSASALAVSTTELYENARRAVASKVTSAASRREGLSSSRRQWTAEEENALMAGMDQVQGPHWSQILALHGAQGTVSTALKDRTQVQLKDKARNLKLFFLKSGTEIPPYLKMVTGELKTRAPLQAARKEAEERARVNSDDDKAHFEGVSALAQGLKPAAAAAQPASPEDQEDKEPTTTAAAAAGPSAHASPSAVPAEADSAAPAPAN